MSVVHAKDAVRFEFRGISVVAPMLAETGATETQAMICYFAPGSSSALHQHDREELVVAVEGGALVELAGEQIPIEAQGGVSVPPGTMHRVVSDHVFTCFIIMPVGTATTTADGRPAPPPWQGTDVWENEE